MDMMVTTGGMANGVNSSMPLIQELGNTASEGIIPGAPLSVPAGYAAVIMRGMQTLYVLGPGEHVLHPQTFPLLAQAKPKRSGLLDGELYLVRATDITDLPWDATMLHTAGAKDNALTCSQLRGRFWGRIADPGRFVPAMLHKAANARKLTKKQAENPIAYAPLSQSALPLLMQALGQAAETGVQQTGIPPAQWQMAHENVSAAVSQTMALEAGQMGIETLGFQVDHIQAGMRVPCVGCGSTTIPTTHATFRRNISLLYVRFGQEQSGNFCASCATKRALTDNGIMLVCGWWGIIGLVLTPIYFCTNLYHLCKVLAAPKQSTDESQRLIQA